MHPKVSEVCLNLTILWSVFLVFRRIIRQVFCGISYCTKFYNIQYSLSLLPENTVLFHLRTFYQPLFSSHFSWTLLFFHRFLAKAHAISHSVLFLTIWSIRFLVLIRILFHFLPCWKPAKHLDKGIKIWGSFYVDGSSC